MSWLAALLHVDADLLRLITAILGLIAAACTATSTVLGVLNRRARLRTEAATASTNAAVLGLVALLTEQKAERAQLWADYKAQRELLDVDEVRRIADEAGSEAATQVLAPVHAFFAAVELVESRRQHRPETDVIEILRKQVAA